MLRSPTLGTTLYHSPLYWLYAVTSPSETTQLYHKPIIPIIPHYTVCQGKVWPVPVRQKYQVVTT